MTPADERDYFERIRGEILYVLAVAQQEGIPAQDISESLCAQGLLLAASLHTGSDEDFMQKARLALMRTGPVEQ